jgi:hypothetical protein
MLSGSWSPSDPRGSGLSYDGVQRRTREKPFVVNNFSSEEEFYRWLTEEFS